MQRGTRGALTNETVRAREKGESHVIAHAQLPRGARLETTSDRLEASALLAIREVSFGRKRDWGELASRLLCGTALGLKH